jgi:cytochrome c-type biogenesis protein CcmF
MSALLGELSLSLSVLVAAAATVLAAVSARLGAPGMLRASRYLIVTTALLLTAASAALVAALLNSEFNVAYVARYTERALPFGYKLAAFWAGQEGSLLLWAWILGVMSVIFVFTTRRLTGIEGAGTTGISAFVLLFFAALMLFTADPFKVTAVVPTDGQGLNPMLQDPAMIAHPPLLFLGYAGYTFPFALIVGALLARRRDSDWLVALRPWSIVSWLFLSIGILLGAQWAYVELGWGGYWAWDPVENASLLPWLTGTALLHSVMVQQHRGMFRKWNAFLVSVTFILCIFGTYLTRSGVIQSVHAFEASAIGTFFLAFLAVTTVFSAGLIFSRRRLLDSELKLEGLLGREGMFLATNVLLVGMTVVTLIGTMFPLISRVFGSREITVGPPFYNKVVAPMGLVLVALMALGPMLSYGPTAAKKLARAIIVPAFLGVLSVLVLALGFKILNPWALVCGLITTLAVAAVTIDLVKAWIQRTRSTGQNPITSLLYLLDSSHRRYGGQVVHIGVLMIVIGVIGSSLFSVDETSQLRPGETKTISGRTITFVQLKETRHANFTSVDAEVKIDEGNGQIATIHPQRRFYDKSEQPNSEVAIRSTWKEDVYVTLAGWEGGGAITAIQVVVNPLVSLLWTGGVVLTIGGMVCLLPRLLPQGRTVDAQREATAPTVRSGSNGRHAPRPQRNRRVATTG